MSHFENDFVTLREYVNAPISDDDFVDKCWHRAIASVSKIVGTASVPAEIMEEAYLECGSELYHRRAAPLGISQFASIDGSPMRIRQDPLASAKRILEPWLPLGLA